MTAALDKPIDEIWIDRRLAIDTAGRFPSLRVGSLDPEYVVEAGINIDFGVQLIVRPDEQNSDLLWAGEGNQQPIATSQDDYANGVDNSSGEAIVSGSTAAALQPLERTQRFTIDVTA